MIPSRDRSLSRPVNKLLLLVRTVSDPLGAKTSADRPPCEAEVKHVSRSPSPVGSIDDGPAVHQDELLLQTSMKLHPRLTLVQRSLDRPNPHVLNKESQNYIIDFLEAVIHHHHHHHHMLQK